MGYIAEEENRGKLLKRPRIRKRGQQPSIEGDCTSLCVMEERAGYGRKVQVIEGPMDY